jgi:esterase/lipase
VRSAVKELVWLEKSGHIILLEEERAEITRLTLDFMARTG